MPLTPTDFTPPEGDLKEQMFPDRQNLTDAIQGWINAANTALSGELSGAALDDGVEAWVYWKAYRDVYLRMSSEPQSVGVSETVNYQYVQAQAERFKELSDEWKETLDTIRYGEEDDPTDELPTSGFSDNTASW